MERFNLNSMVQAQKESEKMRNFISRIINNQKHCYYHEFNDNVITYAFELNEIDFISFTLIIEKLSNDCNVIQVLDKKFNKGELLNKALYKFNYFNIAIYC